MSLGRSSVLEAVFSLSPSALWGLTNCRHTVCCCWRRVLNYPRLQCKITNIMMINLPGYHDLVRSDGPAGQAGKLTYKLPTMSVVNSPSQEIIERVLRG
jgi:hypothetical protein